MHSGRGQLTIDGSEPIEVEYDLGDDGRGYLTADRPHVVKAHLGHLVQLKSQDQTMTLVVDRIGALGGGDFHVTGEVAT